MNLPDDLKNYRADSFQLFDDGIAGLAFICLLILAAFAIGF